jgi:hypothetical protein
MQKERTKMCPSCDGCVSLNETTCPYCRSNLLEENVDERSTPIKEKSKPLSYEESLSSLYPPPYKPKVINSNTLKFEKDPKEDYAHLDDDDDDPEDEDINNKDHVNSKNALIPTVLFWLGVNMFIFSLILIIFSKEGSLHLRFSSKYWFVYSIIALPFLFFGFKSLKDLD